MKSTTSILLLTLSSAIMSGGLVSDVANADESFRVSSGIKGITVTPVNVLPKAPAREKMAAWTACEDMAIKPKTTAGQLVAAKGWVVTGEVKIGNYTAVSFGGKLEFVGNGMCMMTRGNIGIFSEKILAIAYTKKADDPLIGRVDQLDGGGARLYDNFGTAVADLKLTGEDKIILGPLAAFESVCGRKAKVPNIYKLPIDKARKLITDAGWKPVSVKPDDEDSYDNSLRKAGLTETEDCSGTGMGYCRFDYESAAGKLLVVTADQPDVEKGEFPEVMRYWVECNGAK